MVLGYPRGLTKEEIPYEGQIIRVADEYDAIVNKRQYKSHIGIVDTLNILVNETKPAPKDEYNSSGIIKNKKLGKVNPIIVKALIKVVIDDTEYEISCVMNYVKELKKEIKRLKQIDNYHEKMLKSKNDKQKNYYLEGMKIFLIGKETPDNYKEVLNSYLNILQKDEERIENLFKEIKQIKKLKI